MVEATPIAASSEISISRLEQELEPEQLESLARFTDVATQALDQIRVEQDKVTDLEGDRLQPDQYAFYLNRDQIIRFLRARDYNHEKTQTMYIQWVKWRLSYRADKIQIEDIRSMIERPVMAVAGRTRDNCIILLVSPRFHVPGAQHIDDLVRYGIYIIEQAIKQIESEGLEPHIHCIYDRTGMTSSNRDSALIKFAFRMISMLQDFYCERLGNFYVIGANWIFWAAHKMIKPFLAAKTREKLKLIYELPQLQEWIEPEQLIEEHGGTLAYEYNAKEQWGLEPITTDAQV